MAMKHWDRVWGGRWLSIRLSWPLRWVCPSGPFPRSLPRNPCFANNPWRRLHPRWKFHHLETIPDPAAVSSAAAPPSKSISVFFFLFQIGASSLILTYCRGRRSGFPRGFCFVQLGAWWCAWILRGSGHRTFFDGYLARGCCRESSGCWWIHPHHPWVTTVFLKTSSVGFEDRGGWQG